MIERVCQILKGLFITGWLCVQSSPALANTIYVDCTNGNNSNSGTSVGSPKKTITAGIGALSGCTSAPYCELDILASTCTIGAEGNGNNGIIINKAGTSGHPIVIQPYGYSGSFGTGAAVYIEGTIFTPTGWTQCTSATGVCANVTNPVTNVWWYTLNRSNNSGDVLFFARKADGSTTPKRTVTNMINQYDSAPWTGETNYGQNGNAGRTILVRWGPAVSNPNIAGTGVNYGRTDIFSINSPATDITIQGFTIRNGGRTAFQINPGRNNVSILNNKITLFNDSSAGSARPITADSVSGLLVTGNELSYSSSEPLHITTLTTGVVAGTISNNYIHHIGDQTILGDDTQGTPNCTTFTDDAPIVGSCGSVSCTLDSQCTSGTCGRASSGKCDCRLSSSDCTSGVCSLLGRTGDFTGVTLDGNLFDSCRDSTGILFESACDGMQVSNNIITNVPLCFKWSPSNGGLLNHTSSHKVFNNICTKVLNGNHNCAGDCFCMATGVSTDVIANNEVWNNTCISPQIAGIQSKDTTTGITGNRFANNIIYSNADIPAVNWIATSQTNVFKNNDIYSLHATAMTFATSSQTCGARACGDFSCGQIAGADFNNDSASDANICADPGFITLTAPSTSIYIPVGGGSIAPDSVESNATFTPPTLDAGTATGQPAAHTTGIVNTLALQHDFGYYSDAIPQGGAAWDIGATENYIPYPYVPKLSSWTQYTPDTCDVSTFAVASSGTGFVFISHHDATNGCTGLSLPLTLTVGQKYLVYWKMNLVRDFSDVTFDSSTPPNVIAAGSAACPGDSEDTWHLLADNATLEVVNEFADVAHPTFDADLHRTYLLTPTATNVTLKAEVLARGFYASCQDSAYFFKPIAVVPVLGVCSVTRYQSCDPCAVNSGCPVGETCS